MAYVLLIFERLGFVCPHQEFSPGGMGSSCAAGFDWCAAALAGTSRRQFGDLGPIQASNCPFGNRHWQSPGRHHTNLPNSPDSHQEFA